MPQRPRAVFAEDRDIFRQVRTGLHREALGPCRPPFGGADHGPETPIARASAETRATRTEGGAAAVMGISGRRLYAGAG